MRKNIFRSLLLLVAMAALFSCKSRKLLVVKHVDSTRVTTHVSNPLFVKLSAVKARQVDFNTFTGKAKAKLNIDGNSNDVTLNIRIQKNQKIWVSITALLGIEVARAMITPDSILVINRLQGLYLKKPFNYIYTYAAHEVNYKMVESLLVGNAPPELLSDSGKLEFPSDGVFTITGMLQSMMSYRLTANSDNHITQTMLNNAAARQSLQLVNSQYTQVGSLVVPSMIAIRSKAGNHVVDADLTYTRIDFNQSQEYPFSIPSRFSPAD